MERIQGVVRGESPKSKFYCYRKLLIHDDLGIRYIYVHKGLSPKHYKISKEE